MQKNYLYLLSIGHFITDLGPGALPALLPFLVLHYNLNYTEIAGLMFACSCLSSAVQPIFGLMADRSSHHWLMGFGVLITGTAFAVTGWSSNYWVLFAAIAIMGTGSSIFHPQAARFVNLITGKKKGTGMGIFSVGGNAGFGLAPIIVVWAVTAFGLKGVALFAVASILFGAILLALIPKLDRITQQSGETDVRGRVKTVSGKNDWNSFLRLSLVIMGRSIVFCTVTAFLPIFCVRTFGVSEGIASLTLSIFALSCTLMTLVGGVMADRFGLVTTMRWGSVALIPSVAALAFSPNIICAWIVVFIVGFGINATYTSFVVLGQKYLAKNIGFASGVTLGLSFSVGGLVVPLLGKLADATSLQTVFYAAIVLSALCAAGAFLLKEPRDQAKSSDS